MTNHSRRLAKLDSAKSVLCFGEILLRLSAPERRLLAQSDRLEVHVGGAEANVAVGLAHLGHSTRMVSVLPQNELGNMASAALASHGVDVSGIQRSPGRMGLYFLQAGASLRPTKIVYDRSGSAFGSAARESIDWPGLMADAALLHVSGVTPALGPVSIETAMAAVRAARDAKVPISFDCNYRATLWEAWDSRPQGTLASFVEQADILFGNHRDAALLLGNDFTGDGEERRREAAEAMFAAFPNLSHIASTSRRAESVDNHHIAARLDARETAYQTEEVEVAGIVDRIGAGDAFVAGILHGLLSGLDPMATVRAGLAMTCLKHSLPGDAPMFTGEDLAAFMQGSLDVRR